HPHVADDGQAAIGQCPPVGAYTIDGMSRDQRDTARYLAMRQGQAQRTAHRQAGCYAADAFHINAALAQPRHFFAASPEYEGIAALESRNGMAAAGVTCHEPQDKVLRRRGAAPTLADIDDACACRREFQDVRADEVVDQPYRTGLQYPRCFQRK